MTEREPIAPGGSTDTAPPPYDRLGEELTALLTSSGGTVREGFPEQYVVERTLAYYDYATRSRVLHPWTAPRGRVEALLAETVDRLGEKQSRKKRGKQWQNRPRRALGEATLARRWAWPTARTSSGPARSSTS